jgi:hypothetical protein
MESDGVKKRKKNINSDNSNIYEKTQSEDSTDG